MAFTIGNLSISPWPNQSSSSTSASKCSLAPPRVLETHHKKQHRVVHDVLRFHLVTTFPPLLVLPSVCSAFVGASLCLTCAERSWLTPRITCGTSYNFNTQDCSKDVPIKQFMIHVTKHTPRPSKITNKLETIKLQLNCSPTCQGVISSNDENNRAVLVKL